MNQKVRPKELGMLFVVGGPGSSGSSTIATMLADYFSLKRVYGGELFQKELEQEEHKNWESTFYTSPKSKLSDIDARIDEYLLREAKTPNILIESKNFAAIATVQDIPCTVKIWITADLKIRALRAMLKKNRHFSLRNIPLYLKLRHELEERYEIDRKRYNERYGIKYECPKEYNDIVIDSSHLDEKETFELILKYIKDGGYIK